MIRRHLLALTVAAFALVLGLVLGATATSGRLIQAVALERADLTGQVAGLRGQASDDSDRLDATERFVATTAPLTVRTALTGKTVALVTAADADPGDVAALTDLVGRAGGQVTGRLALTDATLAPERSDSVRGLVPRLLPAGTAMPTTTDAGALAGSLVAAVAVRGAGTTAPVAASDAVTALTGLADAGLIRAVPPVAPVPAQLALVVAGPSTDQAQGTELARFAAALDRPGAGGVVLAGRDGSAAVAAARADPRLRTALSTVDGLERPSGRVAGVLALHEQSEGRGGPYGPTAAPSP